MVVPAFFAVYWAISNSLYAESTFSNFNWATSAIRNNKFSSAEDLVRRIWWYPLSLLFTGRFPIHYMLKAHSAISIGRHQPSEITNSARRKISSAEYGGTRFLCCLLGDFQFIIC